jgi:membrane-bound lytic murein transglycosylase C
MKKTALIVASIVAVGMASDIDDIKDSMMMNYLENVENVRIIHKENVDIVKQNAIYYTNIVKSAQKYYSGFVAQEWGEANVKLSSRKSFTQYSKDMKERENIDFEKGVVTIEVVTDVDANTSVEHFNKKLDELQKESSEQALKKDPVAALSIEYMKKKKLAAPVVEEKQKKDVLLKDMLKKQKIKPEQIKEKIVTLKDGKKKKIVSVEVPMVPNHLEKRAKRYKSDVQKMGEKYHVAPSYIFGTIQTESYFNPLAVSYIPAYGLMQIVPTTAGVDAYEALYGKKRVVPPPYLYDPAKNIKLGTKYVQIIRERYLKGVKNKESLDYCTATAYNAGIGSLYRSFTGSKRGRKEAVAKINSMTPDEVYEHLRNSPKLTKEARNYVKRIRDHSANFKKWDEK